MISILFYSIFYNNKNYRFYEIIYFILFIDNFQMKILFTFIL